MSGLPTGTVTLLLADVEGSTRLWKTQPDAMTAAIALLDDTLRDLIELRGRSAACTLENEFPAQPERCRRPESCHARVQDDATAGGFAVNGFACHQ